jgi:CspA family cold shock protein
MIVQGVAEGDHHGTERGGVEGRTWHGLGSYRLHVVGRLICQLRFASMQGVMKSYDPGSGDGVLVDEVNFNDIDLADNALEGSIFRMLRPGQRVQYTLDDEGHATTLRLGSEVDMSTPDL